MSNAMNVGYAPLTDMLSENKKQLIAMTDIAKNILRKIDGDTIQKDELCDSKRIEPELPGVLKQTSNNIMLSGELYSLMLDIESRL